MDGLLAFRYFGRVPAALCRRRRTGSFKHKQHEPALEISERCQTTDCALAEVKGQRSKVPATKC